MMMIYRRTEQFCVCSWAL